MVVLANPKYYAKTCSKKTVNLKDDDDIERSDHDKFQEIFVNVTDDLVEEQEDN